MAPIPTHSPSVRRALTDIRGELRSLTPAEQLAGFDGAIRNLGGKIDMIVRSSHDPATIQQLEDAIAALKTIVANVASNDALNQLGDHVQTLSAKVDQLSLASGGGEFLSALEQRIATLTSAMETRERPAQADSTHFDLACARFPTVSIIFRSATTAVHPSAMSSSGSITCLSD